jgi:hypothetical protein
MWSVPKLQQDIVINYKWHSILCSPVREERGIGKFREKCRAIIYGWQVLGIVLMLLLIFKWFFGIQ